MTGISHEQAINLMNRRLDGLLSESQAFALDGHLDSCEACRTYAREINLLPAHLQSEFHARWDQKSLPSERVFEKVTSEAKGIPMANRISSGTRLFAGIAALLLLGFVINFVASKLQSTPVTSSGGETTNSSLWAGTRLLAFASDQNGNVDIYTVHANGSGLTNLTDNPARDSNPIWSPDGQRIAFESDRDGVTQIYWMKADGSDVVQLTHGEGDHFLPMNIHGNSDPWSPDGTKLLFLGQEPGASTSTLNSLDIGSGTVVMLASGTVQFNNISWSPDGKYIGYVLNDSPTPDAAFVAGLYVVDATGGSRIAINTFLPQTDSLYSPSYYWYRGENSIIFIAYRHLGEGSDQWIAYEAFPERQQLIERATSSTIMDDWWEGTSFIHGTDPYILRWLRADGTSNTLEPLENCDLTMEADYGFLARRSPNGSQVINVVCPNKDMWFYYANPDGTIIKSLADDPIVSFTPDRTATTLNWSSDDQFIAVTQVSPAKSSLYILNVTDPSIQPEEIVISGGELYTIPSWRPVPMPQVAENAPELKIDPQSCKRASELNSPLQPPNELYGYDLVQGISFVDGDFSYEVWLYCDPALQPNDQGNVNAIAGLGIFSSWRYNGPRVDGPVEYHYEFEPNVPLGETSLDGPFYKASAAGMGFGIDIAETTVREYIRHGDPVQFSILVDSPLGQNGVTFSFYFEAAENGLRIIEFLAEKSKPPPGRQ